MYHVYFWEIDSAKFWGKVFVTWAHLMTYTCTYVPNNDWERKCHLRQLLHPFLNGLVESSNWQPLHLWPFEIGRWNFESSSFKPFWTWGVYFYSFRNIHYRIVFSTYLRESLIGLYQQSILIFPYSMMFWHTEFVWCSNLLILF